MKINMPVTDNEVRFETDLALVSKTDLDGKIVYANDAFVQVSGFSRDELIGQNHHIVRHPDMPPEAFGDLWLNIKDNRPWRGFIKNRTKEGDFYWVEAYVTPVFDASKKIGYMSVRSEPARKDIASAEQLYRDIKAKKVKWPRPLQRMRDEKTMIFHTTFWIILTAVLALGSLLISALGTHQVVDLLLTLGTLVALGIMWFQLRRGVFRSYRCAIDALHKLDEGDLSHRVFASDRDRQDQLLTAIESMRIHQRAVISDVLNGCREIHNRVKGLEEEHQKFTKNIQSSKTLSDSAADAVDSISNAVQALSDAIDENAARSVDVRQHATQSGHAMKESVMVSAHTVSVIHDTNRAMNTLKQAIEEVSKFANTIEEISEQTNLLALNAAIEAARAGDHGRGFSVVADEVRNLSVHTAEATIKIQEVVKRIISTTTEVTARLATSLDKADESNTLFDRVSDNLQGVVTAMNEISELFENNASLLKEQSTSIITISDNMSQIRNLSSESSEALDRLGQYEQGVNHRASELNALVRHFKIQPHATY